MHSYCVEKWQKQKQKLLATTVLIVLYFKIDKISILLLASETSATTSGATSNNQKLYLTNVKK